MTPEEFIELLENAFDKASFLEVADEIGFYAVATIDQRTRRGVFLGGEKQSAPYSTRPLNTRKIGSLSKSGSRWKLRSDKQNTSAVLNPDDLQWSSRDGQRTSWLIGGYSRWRQLTGRGLTVDLTFTGAMLNSMTHRILNASASEIQIEVYFNNAEQAEKAFHNNLTREFMALTPEETEKAETMLENRLISLLE